MSQFLTQAQPSLESKKPLELGQWKMVVGDEGWQDTAVQIRVRNEP